MTLAWGELGCALAAALALLATPAAAADFYVSPNDKVVGKLQDYVVHQGDNLADIARKFDIGYTEMVAANLGVQPWTPQVGQTLTIPSLYILPDVPRKGIVINLGERRLYYFPPNGGPMQTYPVGIGAIGFDTPHDTTKVVRKEPNPVWIPPPSIRAEQPDLPAQIGPGPDDPLGDYALRLGWPNYLIHGTNKPDSVGRNASHGCIHLYPEDIDKLFHSVAVGTPVRVIDEPTAAAWIAIGLYVEVHPSKDQADQIDTEQAMTPAAPAGLHDIVAAQTGDHGQNVDWNAVDLAGLQRTGLPIEVAIRAPQPMANNPAPDASMNPVSNIAVNAPAANGPIPLDAPMQQIAPAAAASVSDQSLTPIFNSLQPPPGMAASPTQPPMAAPQDLVGNSFAPALAPSYVPRNGYNDAAMTGGLSADQAAQMPQQMPLGAAPDGGAPPNTPFVDPNAAYNAQFGGQGARQ